LVSDVVPVIGAARSSEFLSVHREVVQCPRLLSIKDAAAYLGARVWAIRQMMRKRELPYLPVGRGFKIDKIDLDRWIERQKIGTGVAA
jgi:excisionase family DNA binding protein